MIDKADSIEEKDESEASEHGSVQHHRTTFSSDDIVIEEETVASSDSDEIRSRKASLIRPKSFDVENVQSKPIEASLLPPTSTSTQTVPTEEFPEVAAATSAAINQADDVREIAQLNVETQQETKIAPEIDTRANDTQKLCSRSTNESDDGDVDDDQQHQQQQRQEMLIAHQQSMSQEDDYEVAMVSGLLPGCVAPAPTPAPSIAPLAEIEVDPAEDDPEGDVVVEQPKPEVERKKKRRERKDRDGGECQAQAEADGSTDPEKSKRNAVCPWEDE